MRTSAQSSRKRRSIEAISGSVGLGRTLVFDSNFERILSQNHIHAPDRVNLPSNLEECRARLKQPNMSQPFKDLQVDHYPRFIRLGDTYRDKEQIMHHIFPEIRGTSNRYPSAGGHSYENWAPLLGLSEEDVEIRPHINYCEGSHSGTRNSQIWHDLSPYTIPSLSPDMPHLPNFFVIIQGYDGSMAAAQRQACYYGALGARGMHKLQNYGVSETYDNKAYTFTAIYQDEVLDIHAHCLTAPEQPGSRPHYHMARVMKCSIANSPEEFRAGTAAFRNLQDLAHECREKFTLDANRRLALVTAA